MTVFVDTSALDALLDTADRNHPRAATTFEIESAFAFEADFDAQGFRTIP